MAWKRSDGFVGEKKLKHSGKWYKLVTVRDARTHANLAATKRKAQKWIGKDGKVLKISNTYSYAVYEPIRGGKG